ncbi:MFS transporter [Roseibium sp.]|uniref:MFS transporter n=1 Tax=Roseibium sp. TaxID=1936156 RepID=UPI003A97E591
MAAEIRARWAVAAVFFMLGSLIGAWAARIPDIKEILELDEAGFGGMLLIMALGAFVAFPFAGQLIDRRGAAIVTKAFVILTLAAFAGLCLGVNVWIMAPAMFFAGFCIGALDVSMNAWGTEVETALKRPVMSSYHGLYSMGAGAGAGAGAIALWAEVAVRGHFLIWTAVMGVLMIAMLRVGWTSDRISGPKTKAPIVAFPKGALFLAGLMALIAALGEGAVTDWAALYQIQELDIESSQAAIGFAVFSVAMVVMRLLGDNVIARFGAVPVARISGFAAFVGAGLLVVGIDIWVIWLGCAIMGLGNAVIFPLAMSRAAADPDMSKGAALASVATLGYGAFLFGPPVLGFVGELISLRAAFGIVAAAALLIVFLAGSLKVSK